MPNRWVTGALILTVISLLGSAIVISQVAQSGGGSGNEVAASCALSQYATGENSSGSFQCKQIGYQELTNTPNIAASTSCPNPQFLQNSSDCNTVPTSYTYIVNDSCGLSITNCSGCVSLPCSNGIITAYPTITGLPKYSGTDCANVLGNVSNSLNAFSNRGVIFVKAGIYFCSRSTGLNLHRSSLVGELPYFSSPNTAGTYLEWASSAPTSAGLIDNFDGLDHIGIVPLISTTTGVNIKQNVTSSYINTVFLLGSSTKGTGINVTANNVFDSNIIFFSFNIGINTFNSLGLYSNILAGAQPSTIPIVDNSSNGNARNTFDQIKTVTVNGKLIQLNSGVGNDSIVNWVGQIIDNSASVSNRACPNYNNAVTGELSCQITNWNQIQNYPAGCPANQFVIGVTTTLSCSAQSAVTTEKAAGCAGAQQFVTTESANGDFSCGIVTYGTCPVNQFATAITTTTLNCGAQLAVSTEAAGGCAANSFATTESANGAFGCGAISTEAIASCGAGLFATSESNDGSFSCNSPNITFQNNTKSCADTTSGTVLMAGFKLNYTTVGTGKVTVNINFQIASPATSGINTKFRIAFGTGNAPGCNAAVTGTKVGNQYEVGTFAATASFETIDLSVGVITLSAATTYWFDIQMQDSTAASWTFSNPQMTIMES